ncbi:sugar transporter ERD6-like 7 [Spodoptera litura]|uniref:Sugar transporter ERD6-like 7 n=1 Tax=Spodoptera litura TaxID=69820 RepID=A0A9J7DQF3_SPOLT|nr:sugar transporter ERD6-like 7 [Spodoptera litura]
MAMTPPRIFASEISLPNMRGVIGSFSTLAISIGISIQAGLGQFLTWPIICYICSIYTIANFLSFFFLPETPYFMLKTKNVAAARVALKHFRARNYDFDKEMEQIKEYKEDMDIH